MNKLRDWLRRVTGGEAPRMGFGAMAPKAKGPTMGLMAALPSLDKKTVSGALESGAEALVVPATLNASAEGIRAAAEPSNRCLWGLELDGARAPEPDLKYDFLLLSSSSALSTLKGEDTGRLLAADLSWDDLKIRVLDQLPVDGIVFTLPLEGEAGLQVEHLLAVRRLSSLVRKPLILQLDRLLSGDDLELLRDGGLSGLLVPDSAAQWADTIQGLRQAIDALPPRGKPRREMDVMLPAVRPERPAQVEEEEEEE